MNEPKKILIVEDELLIAELLARYVRRQGHVPHGITTNVTEARAALAGERPDLVLVDIHLDGSATGLDLAAYINRQPEPVPFIFLTSQTDKQTIDAAMHARPAGYLSKPIRQEDLHAAITLALHRAGHGVDQPTEIATDLVELMVDGELRRIEPGEIEYLVADHIHTHIHTTTQGRIMARTSLSSLLEKLSTRDFIRIHRSYAVNRHVVDELRGLTIRIGKVELPVGRTRRDKVRIFLQG